MIALIALAVSAFWTAVGRAVGMRGGWLIFMCLATFGASLFFLVFNKGAGS